MIRRTRSSAPHARPAFTLFEVLVALALSTLLLAASYAAFDLYWSLRTAGEEEVKQAQIARAILQRIELDLRATVYQPSSQTSTSSDGSSSSGDGETLNEVIHPEDAYSGGNVGLVGDANSLVLSVSLPQSHATYAAVSEGPVGLPTSDLKSVTYVLAGEGLGPLQQAIAARFPRPDDYASSPIAGIARIEGDRLLLTQADAAADVETIASQAQLLAVEVQSLQFEYSDGLDWYQSWDCAQLNGLPRAVRITLSFERLDAVAAATESAEAKLYQVTVVLPPSETFSGGTSSEYESSDDEE